MDFKHTPTTRLILYALRDAHEPQTLTDLCVTTGSAASSLIPLARELARAGLIVRCPGRTATYVLPTAPVQQ